MLLGPGYKANWDASSSSPGLLLQQGPSTYCCSRSSSSYREDMNVSTVPPTACAASAIPYPTVFGAEILGLSANLVQNYSKQVPAEYYHNHPSTSVNGIDFCNVTVTYTHPGQDDTIYVETWLPMKSWNGRLQAVGGGGYTAGRFFLSYTGMAGALAEGYVATTTDSGIGENYVPDPWALNSPGNVDLYALQNLASVSLNDQVCWNRSLSTSRPWGSFADPIHILVHHREGYHQKLLWAARRVLVLERLLSRRPPGIHARPALSRRIRWHCSCSSGFQLGRIHPRSLVGAGHDGDHG